MGEEWVIKIRDAIEEWSPEKDVPKWSRRCIYRVPKRIRELNPDAYTPSVVSFGPYHHGRGDLKLMEPHKQRAVYGFFRRNSSLSFEEVVKAMREHASEMMEAYDNLEEPWTDKDRFVKLMVFDACFLVEILLTSLHENYYDDNDPVFNKSLLKSSLWVDLFKLENQLPMQALSILMQQPSNEEVANYFQECFLFKDLPPQNISARHILDLNRQLRGYAGNYWYCGCDPNKTSTELLQFGVNFKKSETRCFKDITFKNGVFSIPTMKFHDDTEAWFLNILAFEHLHGPRNKCGVHSYVLLMDSLVNTAKDVQVLREREIITGLLGKDEEIAKIYNNLGRRFELLYYEAEEGMDYRVNGKIAEHCRRRWKRRLNLWLASFSHTYLANPWVFLSLLGAFILLVLTILQTAYTMLSYYNS